MVGMALLVGCSSYSESSTYSRPVEVSPKKAPITVFDLPASKAPEAPVSPVAASGVSAPIQPADVGLSSEIAELNMKIKIYGEEKIEMERLLRKAETAHQKNESDIQFYRQKIVSLETKMSGIEAARDALVRVMGGIHKTVSERNEAVAKIRAEAARY